MGFGPATILSTWLWWPAYIASAANGYRTATSAAAVFAVARTLTMMAATLGPVEGAAMAARMHKVTEKQSTITVALIVVGFVSSLSVLFGGLR
jgi:hypothetical protein